MYQFHYWDKTGTPRVYVNAKMLPKKGGAYFILSRDASKLLLRAGDALDDKALVALRKKIADWARAEFGRPLSWELLLELSVAKSGKGVSQQGKEEGEPGEASGKAGRSASKAPGEAALSQPRARAVAVEMLQCIPGVSKALAERLLGRFGSLRGVLLAKHAQLREVPGVGVAIADRVEAVSRARGGARCG